MPLRNHLGGRVTQLLDHMQNRLHLKRVAAASLALMAIVLMASHVKKDRPDDLVLVHEPATTLTIHAPDRSYLKLAVIKTPVRESRKAPVEKKTESTATRREAVPSVDHDLASDSIGRGRASYYGTDFAGWRTASGETFDPEELTAAHRSLPFGSKVRVTNLKNGRSIVVRINDRGPYSGSRIIDLSHRAARDLGMIRRGTAMVQLEILPSSK